MGRPTFDRQLVLDEIVRSSPRAGHNTRRVNGRAIAAALGIDRDTVSAAIGDLEVAGLVRRGKNKRRGGLLVEIIGGRGPTPAPRV